MATITHLHTNDKLDRFEIIEELGRGSQGIVYLARDPKLERNVAIKTFHHSNDILEAREQLLKEARSISRLQHPNILTLYEAGEFRNLPYLVFEYIDGSSLKKLLDYKGKLEDTLALEIMIAVLDGVDYAHDNGIIHRDLTPSNIIITSNNKPKIMDFGIADIIGKQQSEHGIHGSLHYLSPEQCNQQASLPASDIFTLGLILLELLSGKQAVQGDNQFSLINVIVNEEIKVPDTLAPAIGKVIKKALNKNPLERYESAAEMKQELQTYLNSIKPELSEAASNDKDSTLQFLLRRMRHKKDFPAMPQQISDIAISTNDKSDASANILANKILKNYSLSTKLLRLVNSPIYGQYGGRISTVSRAVVILGFKEVRMAAMGLMLFDHLQNDEQSRLLKEYSINSMMSGAIAKELSPELAIEEPEEAYICSMFHKFGRLLTLFYFPEEANIIENKIRQQKIPETTASADVLGLSYEELGIGIAKAWHLPTSIIRSIRKLKASEIEASDHEEDKQSQIANFSNELCDLIQCTPQDNLKVAMQRLLDKYSNTIDLTPKQLNSYIGKAVKNIREYANLFNLNVSESSFIKSLEQWTHTDSTITTKEQLEEAEKKKFIAGQSQNSDKSMDLINSVQEISDSIIDGASLNDAMIMVIETLYRGYNFNRVLFCMINRKNASVDARFGFGQDIDELIENFKIPIEKTPDIFNLALTKHEDYVVDNIDDPAISNLIPDWYRRQISAKSLIVYPIVINKVPMGCIYADYNTPSHLSEHAQLSIIKTLRNQIIMAIRQNSSK